ncbi:MAG: carbamoyl transferase [Deltaproteobacteria bacterium]|nr:carbamoyl transferase [Deltaproteobacteria bacterium]
MNIMGFSAYGHTSSAALIVDGRLVAAAEEERFLRRKYNMTLPLNAARFCLAQAGMTPEDLDQVGYFFDLKLGLPKYMLHAVKHFPRSLKLLTERVPGPEGFELVIKPWRTFNMKKFFLGGLGAMDIGRVNFRFLEHHICHAAHFLESPFEEAAICTLDALGEWTSTGLYDGVGNKIREVGRINFPHSLGAVYAAISTHLGFGAIQGPGKVMGLAAYGDPEHFGPAFRKLFKLLPGGGFKVDLDYFEYHKSRGKRVSEKFVNEFCPQRLAGEDILEDHKDLAAALQTTLEQVMLHLARSLHRRTGRRNLVLAGGVALNSLANGELMRKGPFEKIYIPPSPGDSGTAVGAALLLASQSGLSRQDLFRKTPFLGPMFSEKDIVRAAQARGLNVRRQKDIVKTAVRLISKGNLVGWFQGRMEFGPRALGNRSILADPSRSGTRDRLNNRIKKREAFRPFAPACNQEDMEDLFEDRGESPFMSFVFKARPSAARLLKEAIHVDGGARVQTVRYDTYPLFHRLIQDFKEKTGVPGLLNTSFNASGEPIVCTPEDATRCYLETGLDALIMGDFLVQGPPPPRPHPR